MNALDIRQEIIDLGAEIYALKDKRTVAVAKLAEIEDKISESTARLDAYLNGAVVSFGGLQGNKTPARVLRILVRTGRAMRAPEIAEADNLSEKTVRVALTRLCAKRLIVQSGRGKYLAVEEES